MALEDTTLRAGGVTRYVEPMPVSRDAQGQLLLGSMPLGPLLHETVRENAKWSTPFYVYDLDGVVAGARALDGAFGSAPHLVCYAVKANTAGPIVEAVGRLGIGADVVSGAELSVALRAGIPPERIVYSGVAKRDAEIDQAIGIGDRGIMALQIESLEEIARVLARAKAAGRVARVAIRINPSLKRELLSTHDHIATGHDEAKFGVPRDDVKEAIRRVAAAPSLKLVGLNFHIGSQLTELDGYRASAALLCKIAQEAIAGGCHSLEFLNTGGGFGIDYGSGCAVSPADFAAAVIDEFKRAGLSHLKMVVEPGRSIVGAHGVLVARTVQTKVAGHCQWLMIDAGMNDLIRPALYQARHRIVPLDDHNGAAASWVVVGPVCESSDDFGAHELPATAPDAVAILDAGAYGFTMASHYNGRALPDELFVSNGEVASVLRGRTSAEWAASRFAAASGSG
jgi:diaminopimelate decarboxylase